MQEKYKLNANQVRDIVGKAKHDDEYPLSVIEDETRNFDMDNLTTDDIINLFGSFGIKNKKMDEILKSI